MLMLKRHVLGWHMLLSFSSKGDYREGKFRHIFASYKFYMTPSVGISLLLFSADWDRLG